MFRSQPVSLLSLVFRAIVRSFKSCPQVGRKAALKAAVLGVLCLVGPVSAAVNSSDISRIEEDWEIQLDTPNPDETAPQISVVTTPYADLAGPYTVFEINNFTLPEFSGGGLQLQSWFGENNVGLTQHWVTNTLSTPNEKISYTMTMSLDNGTLQFQVINGVSQTWGNFGGNGSLTLLELDSELLNLNAYSPDCSIKFSRSGFAGQLVKSLKLKSVRYYAGDKLVKTDNQPRTVETFVANP